LTVKNSLLLAICAAASLTGCTTILPGTAQKLPGVDLAAVQPALLDHGNYPIAPRPPLGKVSSPYQGRILEGDRLANNVVLPYEVDPSLLKPVTVGTFTIQDAQSMGGVILPNNVAAAAGAHNFIVGFSTDRQTNDGPYKQLQNMVLMFPDAPAAVAAAADMAAQNTKPAQLDPDAAPPPPPQPVAIPRHPESIASTSPEDHFGTPTISASAFSAHNQYVLVQIVLAPDIDAATNIVAVTLDKQTSLIDRFQPAAPSQYGDLPADPTGLLARTLPPAADNVSINQNAVYETRAALHFADDPPTVAAAFQSAGVRSIAISQTTVYEALDPPGAQQLATTLAAVTTRVEDYDPKAEGISGYPGAACYHSSQTDNLLAAKIYCVAPAGHYVIETYSQQINDARQQVAAQYLMLTAP
jgi:hypothetical protein